MGYFSFYSFCNWKLRTIRPYVDLLFSFASNAKSDIKKENRGSLRRLQKNKKRVRHMILYRSPHRIIYISQNEKWRIARKAVEFRPVDHALAAIANPKTPFLLGIFTESPKNRRPRARRIRQHRTQNNFFAGAKARIWTHTLEIGEYARDRLGKERVWSSWKECEELDLVYPKGFRLLQFGTN